MLRIPLSLTGRPALGPATRWFDRDKFIDDELLGADQALAIEAAEGEAEELRTVDVILGWGKTLPAKMAAARK